MTNRTLKSQLWPEGESEALAAEKGSWTVVASVVSTGSFGGGSKGPEVSGEGVWGPSQGNADLSFLFSPRAVSHMLYGTLYIFCTATGFYMEVKIQVH